MSPRSTPRSVSLPALLPALGHTIISPAGNAHAPSLDSTWRFLSAEAAGLEPATLIIQAR